MSQFKKYLEIVQEGVYKDSGKFLKDKNIKIGILVGDKVYFSDVPIRGSHTIKEAIDAFNKSEGINGKIRIANSNTDLMNKGIDIENDKFMKKYLDLQITFGTRAATFIDK